MRAEHWELFPSQLYKPPWNNCNILGNLVNNNWFMLDTSIQSSSIVAQLLCFYHQAWRKTVSSCINVLNEHNFMPHYMQEAHFVLVPQEPTLLLHECDKVTLKFLVCQTSTICHFCHYFYLNPKVRKVDNVLAHVKEHMLPKYLRNHCTNFIEPFRM